MNHSFIHLMQSKIYTDREALATHLQGSEPFKRIVFTNGCFDILHRGHLLYLAKARDLGDLLVVAINSDESVKKLKGPTRPVNSESDRALQLAALSFVDYVTFFSESTPEKTIEILKPDIHTKGGDYKPEDLPEKVILDRIGAKIAIIAFEDGYSTTSIINRMKG
jgi:rfaE bifunctional protein nucleotidyltransferase chain/domain